MFGIGRSIKKKMRRSQLEGFEKRLDELFFDYPRFTEGEIDFLNKPFRFNDSHSFISTYREIFKSDIYRFNPSAENRIILDCGANMGLSVLFFSMNYPKHKIVAFEPDPDIFRILSQNVKSYQLSNVEIHQKAVWDKVETLKFFTDKGMGGRVETTYYDQEPMLIETVVLKDYLNEQVDFLKIDIEGAEDVILRHCREMLSNAKHIFFEYHNNIKKEQTLHELLGLVKEQGFHYYIKESGVRKSPFVDTELICEVFDMAINVFCYKK